jgi:hypothetical protein
MNLAKAIGMLVILGLPFAIIEGMWSEPTLRDFARSFNGSKSMWISLGIYYGIVLLIFVLKIRTKEVTRR